MPDASISARFLRRHWTFVGLLLLGAFLVAIVGNDRFPLVDRDEPLYAQASRQMLESGDWTTPRYLDALRLKKPALIYWLQASSMNVLGDTAFAARLPSAIASVLTLALLSIVLPRIVGHRRAFWATFVFATSLLPTYLSKVCMTDAVLHLWIAGGMLCLFAIWRGHARWPTVVALGLAIGLAVLTKGPPILLYLGMTLVALWVLNATVDGREAELRVIDPQRFLPAATMKVIVVTILAALVVFPWVRALETAHPGAVASMLIKEVVARGAVPQEGHAGPPGYYAITFWGTYFPWCLLWPAALWQAWKRRRIAWVRFSLAAVLGPWAFLEIYRTKLPHYWLPSYPFMSILVADVLLRSAGARIADLRDRPFLIATGVVGAFVTIAAFVVLLIPPFIDGPVWPGLLTGLLIVVGIGVAARYVLARVNEGKLMHAGAAMGLTLWAVIAIAFAVYIPATPSLTLASRVGTDLRERMKSSPGAARMVDFKEPSVAFYQGGTIREESNGDFLQTTPRDRWPRWLIIDVNTWHDQPEAVRRRWHEAATHVGFNLAGDGVHPQTILTLENRDAPTTMPVAMQRSE